MNPPNAEVSRAATLLRIARYAAASSAILLAIAGPGHRFGILPFDLALKGPFLISALTEPRRALIGTGFPFKDLKQLRVYLAQFAAVLGGASGIRRAGSAALDLVDVAAGRFDAFWEVSLAPWDIAAGVVLVREAGGRVTRPDGSEDVLGHGPIVAGNPALHAWLIDLLRKA